MRHYIAVFDPASNKLQVTEAKRMTVRSSVRQIERPSTPSDNDDDEDKTTAAPPSASQYSRAALTEAFGTKKSRKAVAAVAENRLLAHGGDSIDNPISAAILSTIKDEDDNNNEGSDSLQSSIEQESSSQSRANKPLPLADLTATEISQVYPLTSLIFPGPPHTTLSQMPIAYWRDRVAHKKDIVTRSRFVSNRVQHLAQQHLADRESPSPLQLLQLLRYTLLLIEIYTYTTRLPPRQPIPPPEKWPAKTTTDASLSTNFLASLVAHFYPSGSPTHHAKTLLTTTILALTLQIPPPKFRPGPATPLLVTEPTDIALDLALQPADVAKLYRQLGCRMETVSDSDLRSWGWERLANRAGVKVKDAQGNQVALPRLKFAKLKFPIEFPKVSAGRPSRR